MKSFSGHQKRRRRTSVFQTSVASEFPQGAMKTSPQVGYQLPQPSKLDGKEIAELARSVAKAVGFSPGAPIEPVVRSLGGQIVYTDLDALEENENPSVGWIQVEGAGDFRIFLSDDTNQERDQFTLAHELGHYVLHYLLPVSRKEGGFRLRAKLTEQLVRDKSAGELAEDEANRFAFEFLMPEERFRTQFGDYNGDLEVVAVFFGVPKWIAEVRAKMLGLKAS